MSIKMEGKFDIDLAFSQLITDFIKDLCSEYPPDKVKPILDQVLNEELSKHKVEIKPLLNDTGEGELAKVLHKEYDLITSKGMISIETIPEEKLFQGGLGIQISPNGKVWVCIDGVSFLRFNPYTPNYLKRGNR